MNEPEAITGDWPVYTNLDSQEPEPTGYPTIEWDL